MVVNAGAAPFAHAPPSDDYAAFAALRQARAPCARPHAAPRTRRARTRAAGGRGGVWCVCLCAGAGQGGLTALEVAEAWDREEVCDVLRGGCAPGTASGCKQPRAHGAEEGGRGVYAFVCVQECTCLLVRAHLYVLGGGTVCA